MGYTFSAALVKKTGTAPASRKAIREGLENLGYRKARNAADASLVLPLHHDKKSAWMTIALEMPESLDGQMEFLRKLAEEMHTAILYFMNFDSDFLYIGATDGKAVQHVHGGFIDEEDEAMTDSDDLSVFDALLPDEAARAEFRRILAVDDEERVFSEEAAQEMAALFGYPPEALFVDEDAEPFAVLAFDPPGQEDVPFLMPEDAPPAFSGDRHTVTSYNPSSIVVDTIGGAGRGIRVELRADGYDAEDWEACCIWLRNSVTDTAPEAYECKVVPKRVVFDDGKKGWVANFPDAPIFRGANLESPAAQSMRAFGHYSSTSYILTLAFAGGRIKELPPAMPVVDGPENFSRILDYFEELRQFSRHRTEITEVYVLPMENPDGGIMCKLPRVPLQLNEYSSWLDGYLRDETFEQPE